jgi:hypothetical protein
MGWLADKQVETTARLRTVIDPHVPPGETLRGAVYANKRTTFSGKLYAIGVTDEHLLMQEVVRKWNPVGEQVVATADDIEVGMMYADGGGWSLTV